MAANDAKKFPGSRLSAIEQNARLACIFQLPRTGSHIARQEAGLPHLAKIAIRLLAAVVLVNDHPWSLEPISIPSAGWHKGLGNHAPQADFILFALQLAMS